MYTRQATLLFETHTPLFRPWVIPSDIPPSLSHLSRFWNTEDKISDKRSSKDYWTQVLQGIKMWDNSPPPPPPLKTSIHRNVIYHKSPTLTVWRLGANSWIKVWRVVWRANCPVTTADHLCMIALRTLLHFSEKKHFQWALLFFFLKGGHVKVPQSMSQWGCERGWVCYRSKLNSG